MVSVMPYVSIRTSKDVAPETLQTLQLEMGRIIALIPGKTIDNCLTQIEGNCHLFIKGAAANAVFMEVRLYGQAPKEAKAAFTQEAAELLKSQLGVETIYINFLEFNEWGGANGYSSR